MRKLYYLAACLLALCTSCSDWLDVKPKTNVEEEDLFKNEQGFKEALTGIYIKMSETQLYGRTNFLPSHIYPKSFRFPGNIPVRPTFRG